MVVDRVHRALHERLLLEGPSGAGKSTLAAIVAGLREPRSGLVLLDGLDMRTLGERGWRRRVASAPQFHENHILTGTLAFNLLSMCVGYFVPRLARVERRQATAIGMEIGVHNGTLAIAIALNQRLAPSVPDPSECATARAKTTTVARWICRQRRAPIRRRR